MSNKKENTFECAVPCPNLFEDEEYELNDLDDTVYQPLRSHRDADDHAYMQINNRFPHQTEQERSAAVDDGYIPMNIKLSRKIKDCSISNDDNAYPILEGETSSLTDMTDQKAIADLNSGNTIGVTDTYVPLGQTEKKKRSTESNQEYKNIKTDNETVNQKTENSTIAETYSKDSESAVTCTGAISLPGESEIDEHGYIPMVGKQTSKAEKNTEKDAILTTGHTYLTLIEEPNAESCKDKSNDSTKNSTEEDNKDYAYAYATAIREPTNSQSDTTSNKYAYATTTEETSRQLLKSVKIDKCNSNIAHSTNTISVDEHGYITAGDKSSNRDEKSDFVEFDQVVVGETSDRRDGENAGETLGQILMKKTNKKDMSDNAYSTTDSDLSSKAERSHSAEIEEGDYAVIPADIGQSALEELSLNAETDVNNYNFITIESELSGQEEQTMNVEIDSNDYASITSYLNDNCKISRLHIIALLTVVIVIVGAAIGLKYLLGSSKPKLTISPSTYYVNIGQSVTLQCSVSSNDAITYVSWRRNHGEVFTDITSTTNPDKYSGSTIATPSLTIKETDTTDAGSYTCFATNSVGTGFSNLGHLFVLDPVPNVIISPTKYSVNKGQSITISCNISSHRAVTSVSWKKDTLPITFADNKFIGSTVKTPSLTIDNADANDTGRYTCIATNHAGKGFSNIGSLTVITEPAVTIPQNTYFVTAGQQITIECFVSSVVLVTSVSWQKTDDKYSIDPTANSNKYSGGIVTTPSLTIKNSEPKDAGNYTCSATNSVGTGLSNTGILYITGTKPKVSVDPTKYSLTAEQNVTMNCSIVSQAEIKFVSWQRNTENKAFNITSKTNPRKYIGGNATIPSLTIVDADSDDAGNYTCLATNYFGTSTSNSGTLRIKGTLPNVTISPMIYSVIADLNVTMQCNVSSDLTVKSVSWQKYIGNETTTIKPETNPSKYVGSTVNTPSLTIVNADSDDAGSYICVAKNSFGTDSSNSGNLSVTGTVPNVTISPIIYSVHADQNVTIHCYISSDLTVKSVSWGLYTENASTTITPETNPSKYVGSTVNTPSLTIVNADSDDAGTYICFAKNSFGTDSSNSGNLSVTGTVPTVKIYPFNNSVTAGQSVTLSCSVYSNLTIRHVTWRKYVGLEDTSITSKSNIYKYSGSTIDTPSLTIFNVISDDAAGYTCSVTNSFGSGSSYTATLSVTGRDEFEFVIFLPTDEYYKLLIYSSQNGLLQLKGTNENMVNRTMTLKAGDNEVSFFCDGQLDQTVRVISSVPVYLFGFISFYDAFYIIPMQYLAKQYIIPECHCSFYSIGLSSLDTHTQVNLTIHSEKNVIVNEKIYTDGGIVKLNLDPYMYESLEFSSFFSMSQSFVITITSTAPIAVMFLGEYGSFVENILPVNQQDTDFIVPIMPTDGNVKVMVFSYYQNTVTIYSDEMMIQRDIQPGGQHSFLRKTTTISYIKATSSLLVIIVPELDSMMKIMMTIHGENHYKSEYFFVVPGTSILIFSSYGNYTEGFEIDGKPLKVTSVTTKIVGDKILSSFTLKVTKGAHRVINSKKYLFGLWVYCDRQIGDFGLCNYGFPAGIRFN